MTFGTWLLYAAQRTATACRPTAAPSRSTPAYQSRTWCCLCGAAR